MNWLTETQRPLECKSQFPFIVSPMENNNNNKKNDRKDATTDFFKLAEIEVVENHLKKVMKHYRIASKKSAALSSWKSVYANLEALTLFIRAHNAWCSPDYADKTFARRAASLFNAFGAAWVCTADRLCHFASFSESYLPSIRSVVRTTLTMGYSMMERLPENNSGWPEKLESLWTGVPLPGELMRKRESSGTTEGSGKKNKAAAKKKKNVEEDVVKGKPRKGKKVMDDANEERDPSELWDFKEAVDSLKAGRKQIGGTLFDLDHLTIDERKRLASSLSTLCVSNVAA